jgi:dolichyl-phosphate-mannose--protein O-mannosyl transferase
MEEDRLWHQSGTSTLGEGASGDPSSADAPQGARTQGLASFKDEAYFDGRDFIFGNGGEAEADRITFRARMAAATLSLLLGLLVFLAAREMFGDGAALFALALVVFEPSTIAHGAYVTTDMGISCFMFACIYALYRYVKTRLRSGG